MNTPILVRCFAWSDGGNEFIFNDGVVLSFGNNMESMVVDYPTPGRSPEHVLTHLCLSHHIPYLELALSTYNTFSAQPRLLRASSELTICQAKSSHCDNLILSDDPRLYTVVKNGEVDGRPITHGVQTCALGIVTLILHPGRNVFSIRWPANTSSGPTEIEQMFPCCSPPPEWKQMLSIALRNDFERTDGDAPCGGPGSTSILPLPEPVRFSPYSRVRFSEMTHDNANSLRISSGANALRCAEKLHDACLLWYVEYDLLDSQFPRVFWAFPCVSSGGKSESVICYNIEDLSIVCLDDVAEGSCTVRHDTLLGSSLYRVSRRPGSAEAYPSQVYGKYTSALHGELLACVRSTHASLRGSQTQLFERRAGANCFLLGRYLASNVSFVLCAAGHLVGRRIASKPQKRHDLNRIEVRCASRVPGVGIFTAYTNESYRCVFDDRTMATVTFKPQTQDLGRFDLICPDGERISTSTSSVAPDNPFSGYLKYLMAFRLFALSYGGGRDFEATNGMSFTTASNKSTESVDELISQTRSVLLALSNDSGGV